MQYSNFVRAPEDYNSFRNFLNSTRANTFIRNCQNGKGDEFPEEFSDVKSHINRCYDTYFQRLTEASILYQTKQDEEEEF